MGDVSDESLVGFLVRDFFDDFGRIDYVVNCAGILGPEVKTHETSTALFDKINNVNYKGTWLVNRQLLSRMRNQEPLPEHPLQRGAIVNIASQLGIVARPAAGKSNTLAAFSWDSHYANVDSFSASCLLRLQGCHHPDDQVRCHRLLGGQHQGQLRLPRSH